MTKLPKIKDVKVPINIQEEPLDAKSIPISVKAQSNIEGVIDDLKLKLKLKNAERVADFKQRVIREGHTDEELIDTFLTGKITWKLSQIGKENTPEEMEEQKRKFGKKYLADLTIDQIIDEIAMLSIDMMERKEILDHIIASTLYEILRKPEDLRKHLFESYEQVLEDVEETDMYDMFKDVSKVQDIKDDEVKN